MENKHFINLQHKLILLLEKCRGQMTAVVIMYPDDDIENRLMDCVADIDAMRQELMRN